LDVRHCNAYILELFNLVEWHHFLGLSGQLFLLLLYYTIKTIQVVIVFTHQRARCKWPNSTRNENVKDLLLGRTGAHFQKDQRIRDVAGVPTITATAVAAATAAAAVVVVVVVKARVL
jgi:hypothetical protein